MNPVMSNTSPACFSRHISPARVAYLGHYSRIPFLSVLRGNFFAAGLRIFPCYKPIGNSGAKWLECRCKLGPGIGRDSEIDGFSLQNSLLPGKGHRRETVRTANHPDAR